MRRVLFALATVALLGCGDTTDPTASGYVGTYTLVTVGGVALPAPSGDPGQTITAGSVVLRSDNTFTYSETRNPSGGGDNGTSGTYSLSGANITFTPTTVGDTGATGAFSSDGATLTVNPGEGGEGILVFHKA